MDEKKTLLIVNPASGVNSKVGMGPKLSDALSQMGRTVETVLTEGPGHAAELSAMAVRQGFGSVVVCGGDGTVNEAAAPLCDTGVTLGIVPSGSGNGLARHLDIPVDETLSLDIIRRGCSILCDCGEVEACTSDGERFVRKFFCTFGLGFDAAVAREFAHVPRRGRTTYIKKLFEVFGSYSPYTYHVESAGENEDVKALLVAFCNATQYGNNAFIAPKASVTDGMLDLVSIKSGNALRMALAGFDMMTGMVPYNHGIETRRTASATVMADVDVAAHIDGEPLMLRGGEPAHVRCLPGRLRAYCGNNVGRVVPFVTPIDLTLRDWTIAVRKLFRI